MTAPWTPTGDKWPQPAMVMVYEQEDQVAALGKPHEATNIGDRWVCSDILHPMPPAITPEQQAVLDAAVNYRYAVVNCQPGQAGRDAVDWMRSKLLQATAALHASRQPPDPVAEVKAAFVGYFGVNEGSFDGSPQYKRLRAAIAALEAKS